MPNKLKKYQYFRSDQFGPLHSWSLGRDCLCSDNRSFVCGREAKNKRIYWTWLCMRVSLLFFTRADILDLVIYACFCSCLLFFSHWCLSRGRRDFLPTFGPSSRTSKTFVVEPKFPFLFCVSAWVCNYQSMWCVSQRAIALKYLTTGCRLK